MCGIVATFKTKNLEKKTLKSMLSAIAHRGEKDFSISKINGVLLSITQLKIVDRDNETQPIYNEDKTVVVILNGEIYNYKTLQENLKKQGHIFRTDCDTEVIVHLYEEYGINFISMLDGMFAFILYDDKKKKYLAVRDYYGVKPLYYAHHNEILYFSSEMKSLIELDINEIFELPPGHYILNNNLKKYYSIPENISKDITFYNAKNEVRDLIEEAVRKRVQTDLPIGVLFSGGIDSTIVLSLAIKYYNDVTALIVGFNDAPDVVYAKKFCKEKNIKYFHYEIKFDEIISVIPDVIYTVESFEPNLIRGSVLSYLLCRLAKKYGFKLLLCGEGSDEIFAGYGDFLYKNEIEFKNNILSLLKDLHRTQLQRVDRTSMAFTIEVREPLLDRLLVEYVLKLPPTYKVAKNSNGVITTKFILREAFEDILPSYIYKREKMTLMKGAGLGKVDSDDGMLYNFANHSISDKEFHDWKINFPEYKLKNKEEVYYFKIFSKYFLKAKFAQKRPYHAQKEIMSDSYEN